MPKTSTDATQALRVAALALAALLAFAAAACSRPGAAPASSGSPALDASSGSPDAESPAADAAAEAADGGQADAACPADAGTADAGAAAARWSEPPRALNAKIRAVASGEPRALVRGGANEDVSPDSRFEVELPRLADFRVRLLDEADRAVASTDRAEIADRLSYQLAPVEALVTGSRYALVVDGLKSEFATDDHGRAYELLRVDLKTSGEKPPKPASKRSRAGKTRKSAH